MALFSNSQRYLALMMFAVLAIPLMGTIASPTGADASDETTLSEWPLCQHWDSCTRDLDHYLQGHFGFRRLMIEANSVLHFLARTPTTSRVIYGLDGKLFYADESVIQQTVGTAFRKERIERFVEIAQSIKRQLDLERIQFLVAPPPNPHTIESEQLPAWIRERSPHNRELNYLARLLSDARVPMVDLRPALLEAHNAAQVYFQTDTHWNFLGALIALNSVMRSAGHSRLVLSVQDGLQARHETGSGDLARFLGVDRFIHDFNYAVKLPLPRANEVSPISVFEVYSKPQPALTDFAVQTKNAGLSIMIIGDSYTHDFWPPLLLSRVARLAWMHHRNCNFDFSAVEKFKPDLLIWAPVERYIPCSEGAWPHGLVRECAGCAKQTPTVQPEMAHVAINWPAEFFALSKADLAQVRFEKFLNVEKGRNSWSLRPDIDPKIFFQVPATDGWPKCTSLSVSVVVQSNEADVVQLFFKPTGQTNFSETDSIKLPLPATTTGKFRTIQFQVTSARGFDRHLRLDPVYEKTQIELRDIVVRCGESPENTAEEEIQK